MKYFYCAFFLSTTLVFGIDLEIPNWAHLVDFDGAMRTTHVQNHELFKSIYEQNNLGQIEPKKQPKIPKISHMIWFGSEFPARFHFERENLIKGHPDWLHILWVNNPNNYIYGMLIEHAKYINIIKNDSEYLGKSLIIDIKDFELFNQKYFDSSTNIIEKSDIARYEIIYKFGGVYIDVDYRVIKPLDILCHSYNFFAGAMHCENTLVVNNAIFGAAPGHLVLKECIRSIKDNHRYIHTDLRTGSLHFTKAFIEQYDNCPGINIVLPCTFFFPISQYEHFLQPSDKLALLKPETFGVHFWMSRWLDESMLNSRLIIGSDPAAGLFSCFLTVLSNIAYAHEYKKIPIVYWDEKTLYYQPQGYNGATNVWEYYFEPITEATYMPEDKDLLWRFYGSATQQISIENDIDKNFIKNIKKTIIDKHIKIKPHILKKVTDYYTKNMAGKRTIGIHLRGTDKHTETRQVPLQKIIEVANNISDAKTQFLIATDEQKLLVQAKEQLRGPIITYDSQRAADEKPMHKQVEGYNKAKLGEEALIEVLFLAKCDTFIHTISNFSYAVLLFNPDIHNIRLKNDD